MCRAPVPSRLLSAPAPELQCTSAKFCDDTTLWTGNNTFELVQVWGPKYRQLKMILRNTCSNIDAIIQKTGQGESTALLGAGASVGKSTRFYDRTFPD